MKNDKLPYISVIITAYNRKEFLLNAIKSVLNQTLDKKYYEIIVIKNFTDKNIDDFINENKIKPIFIDGTIGEYLYKGISEANGEIISFLDDDDLFFENKLEIVYKEFKKDNNIVYYHNLYMPVNRNGATINENSVYTALDFNMSCISIKKSIIKINEADKINITAIQDVLMYLYALDSNKKIVAGKEKLTYYMLHESSSNIVTNNFEEYKKFVIAQSDLHLNCYIVFNNLFHSKKVVNHLNLRITGLEIHKYIFGSNEIPTRLINYVINGSGSLKFRIKMFSVCIVIKVYPSARKYIGNKMWNGYMNQANTMT
jgi:glycosyltransferase involved in cell wall biosynthesis